MTHSHLEMIVDVRDVVKQFKNVTAANHINLQIEPGEYVALLGPNGAGKTTLVEMIEGIQKPDSGSIKIFGKTWSEAPKVIQHRLGLCLQETRFYDKLSVKETMNLFVSFYDQPLHRTQEVLEMVRLEEKKNTFTKNLSGGQRQRLALGIALIHEPDLLLLDEPTTGLDPNSRRMIWDILKAQKQRNSSLILTTHYMEEAESLCDRIIIMDQGNFIAQGSLRELLEQQDGNEIIDFSASAANPSWDFANLRGVRKVEWDSRTGNGKLRVHHITETLPELLSFLQQQNSDLLRLECHPITLDDLFIQMTGRHLDG